MLLYGQYARKSDDDKSVTQKSITDQLAELRFIVERENLLVVKTWEESKSAKIPYRRPHYTEMISLIEAGKINALLCWHINRLARNMAEGGLLVQLFVDGKIKEIRTPSSVYRTGDNILPLVIEAASATQFSLDHTRAVGRGMKSKFAIGGCNYKSPQGYLNARHPINNKIGIITKDPARFDLIRKAWEMFLTGSYTPVQVTQTLNDIWGYRTRETKKTPSGPMSRGYGYKMFANPFYLGYVKEHGQLVRSPEIEPMVTQAEFDKAQELLGRNTAQSQRTHEYSYTGLMVCAYCKQQISAETKWVNGDWWINYRCSDSYNRCTKMGMTSKKVEEQIVEALSRITVEKELCEEALQNILRDLGTQTAPVGTLYAQQNRALEQIEKKLLNLADMWIGGLMRDAELYQEKEAQLTQEKNALLLETERVRQELEHMRSNAMAASNYVVFARDHFMMAPAKRKREIAHALGIKYVFYGKEKEIELEIDPLLLELVRYAKALKPSFEVAKSGSDKEKKPAFAGFIPSGGAQGSLFEVSTTLLELLRKSYFPNLKLS